MNNNSTSQPPPAIYRDPATFIVPATTDASTRDQVEKKEQDEGLYSETSKFSGLPSAPTQNPSQKVRQSEATYIPPASTHVPVDDLSGPPPQLGTPNLHSERSDQWAAHILDTITDDPTSTTTTHSATAASTPGLNVPGSFPGPAGAANAVQADVEKVKEVAYNALQTAREYVGVAGEKVAPYLPQTVAGYVKPAAAPAGQPTTPFAGEDEIAKLPEERRQEAFPSHDDEGFTPLGKSGGVGPLPGTSHESGVAVLPDEKSQSPGGESTGHKSNNFDPLDLGAVLHPRLQVEPDANAGHAGAELPGTAIPERNVPGAGHDQKASHHLQFTDTADFKPAPTFHDAPSAALGAGVSGLGAAGQSHATEERQQPHLQFKDPSPFTNAPNSQVGPGGPSLGAGVSGFGASGQGLGGGPSQNASTNASIKSLAGSKDLDASDHQENAGLETLREHTASAPQTGSAGVSVSPIRSGSKHSPTESNKPSPTSTRDDHATTHPTSTSVKSTHDQVKFDTTDNHTPVNATNNRSPVIPTKLSTEPERPPAVPQKDRFDSDMATTGHADGGVSVTTTTNTIRHSSPPAAGSGVNTHPAPGTNTNPTINTNVPRSSGYSSSNMSRDSTNVHQGSPTSTSSFNGKKPKFMDKLKGEAKVISGKLGRDEEKVLEGRRMMGKN